MEVRQVEVRQAEVRQVLEYPLPALKIGVEELVIEARGDKKQSAVFDVKNSGGGTLEGRIVSTETCLAFEPDRWSGNRKEITCSFTSDTVEGWKPGDVCEFDALILSNGGEIRLPITVRFAKMAITTKEGTSIANLNDFCAYAEDFPEEALLLFADDKFLALLEAIDFPYIDAYSLLAMEENRFRALDNFFILAGLKKRTTLIVQNPEIEHSTLSNSLIKGEFELQKSDSGYVEIELSTVTGAAWLSLELDGFVVKYTIDPLLIEGRYARERVIISEEVYVDIIFKRPMPLVLRLSREGYKFQDEGEVILENQTGEPMAIEIICKEPFVRFYEREYTVEDRLSVPFVIKLSPLQSAQMLFRKVPALVAEIEIRGKYKSEIVGKVLTLTAGEW